jgi:hypothetical protein
LIVSQQNSCMDVPGDWKEMPAGPCLIFVRQCLLSNRSSKPMNRPDVFFLHNINAVDHAVGAISLCDHALNTRAQVAARR